MKVKYFAYFRNETKCKEEDFSFKGITALQLLLHISEKYGSVLADQLLTEDRQEVNKEVIYLINGRTIDFLQGKDSLIQENDVIALFPRVAGG